MRRSALPRNRVPAALAVALTLTGCGNDAAGPGVPAGTLQIQLEHRVAGAPLELQAVRYDNAAGNHYNVFELRYFLSDWALESNSGALVAGPAIVYRDQADAATATVRFPGIPDGDYTALHFRFGLDPARNVPGGLPPSVAATVMSWPDLLGGGYHYMQLDGRFDDAGTDRGWMAHLGRLDRAGDPAPVDPSFTVTLPVQLHVAGDTQTLTVVMDVNQWFQGNSVYDFEVVGNFNMDNASALQALHDNGAAVFGVEPGPVH